MARALSSLVSIMPPLMLELCAWIVPPSTSASWWPGSASSALPILYSASL